MSQDQPPSPDSDRPDEGPTVIPYQSGSDQVEARFGMPVWGQLAFGAMFFLVSVVLVVLTAAGAGGLSAVVFVGLILIAVHVHRDWRWGAFTGGILITFCGCIMTFGICAALR